MKATCTKAKRWQNYMVLFLMLFFTSFMSYKGYTGLPRGAVFVIVYIAMIVLMTNQAYLKGKMMGRMVNLTIVSFLLSCIPSVIVFGQSIFEAITGIQMYIFPMLLYYVLHKWRIDEKVIFKYLVAFTAAFGFFEVIQQYTYPVFWFNGREANEFTGLLEERMGFWRFYLFGIDYCILSIMLCFGKNLKKEGKQSHNYLIFLVCAVAIYFFLARKDIYAVVSCVAIGTLFYSKKGGNIWGKIIIALLLIGAYLFLSNAMTDLNEQTQTEMGESSEDFIRFIAADYFINSFSSSPLYYIFGAGVPGGTNNFLAHQITYLIDNMSIYQDDCGFVGYFSRFGIFGIALQVLILIRIARNCKYLDMGLLMFALIQLEMSFFDFWGNTTRHLAAWAIFLYLIDRNFENNRKNNNKNYGEYFK